MALLGLTRRFSQINVDVADRLRSLKHLAVVDLNFSIIFPRYRVPIQEDRERKREEFSKGWKKLLIRVLEDNPSGGRKLLRWKFTESIETTWYSGYEQATVTENGELEVLPKASLVV